MSVSIDGTGSITGLSVGGLPDGSVDADSIAAGAVTNAKLGTGIDAAKLADGTVTSTELQYINSLSSNAQTQISGVGGGKVLQVVYGYDATETTISGSSLIATGLTATITTSAANSKVLVLVSQMGIVKTTGSGSNTCITIKLHQDSTAVRSLSLYLGYTGNLTNTRYSGVSGSYLSATVSSASTAITFSTKALITTGGGNMSTEGNGTESSITLIEVSA